MIYSYTLSLPANTPEANPVSEIMKLTNGVIHGIAIQFPVGCSELAKVGIKHGLNQVWPTNPDGKFCADGYVISSIEDYELDTPPYELTLEGWNNDDTYVHNITVWVSILPRRSILRYIFGNLYALILEKGGI